ncbi:lysine-specific demethylase lid isoform X2 [Ipomoea triloba]|uniref:lysine-specific demethylase lid isoform X2 n=1 Tax=Ipomoea triloba TaxID=35885 RepID=UPI00125E96FF|nr:lysine-specific demethylase lid isoform X2 [Ipomoea triloba]
MGRGRPRAVEKGVLGQNTSASRSGSFNIPPGPVYYPTEEDFRDPLEYIYKIKEEAEKYGICKIVPPKNWKPPFALDRDLFTFPTKTQAIHQLQARCASCDPKTFELEYNRFLEEHCGRKGKKRVVFEGAELDFCKLFNAVKRFGGYEKVAKEKKWGEVFRFVRSGGKITECAKHVLSQLYLEHLYDYEEYCAKLNKVRNKGCKRRSIPDRKSVHEFESSSSKRRRKNTEGERHEMHKAKEEEFDQICEQCKSGLHGEVMLLCDRCNKGWHIYCLSPPLKQVPPGNWYCLECLNSEKDSFGFVPGKDFSLEAFRRVDDRAKRKWFGSSSVSRVQLEKKFWEIVEGLAGEVDVLYGNDLDTSVYGSGFPRGTDQRPTTVGAEIWDEYCASPWNLNNLPKLQGSVLQAVHQNIAGVMVPWLYIGMLFSSFCWHFEDHCFYSMNYHHWGEPKCWYSVPGSEVHAFEKVMRNSLPDLFDAQPDLLFQLVTMLNPCVLQENGVPVYSVLQEPGNFIITFPRSYHSGFNFGLNCAEAVNFAPADWLPHGGFGAELYQLYRKAAVLSHEELLCVVAKNDLDTKVSPYLKMELLRVYNKEKSWRERLWRNGIVNSSTMSPRKQPQYVTTEEDPTCIICQQYLYLSAVACSCRPSAFVCLEHWEHLCECKANKLCLLYRHTLAELRDLVLFTDKHCSEDAAKNIQNQALSSIDSAALSKKVKGNSVNHEQLADKWLLKCNKILQSPYSSDAYINALKEAEQFLWAGHEMDPVREMAKKLIESQNWAQNVRNCLSRLESWSCNGDHDFEKVQMELVDNLLSLSPAPCTDSAYLKLKDYQKKARVLIQEIDSVLSSCPKISVAELDNLQSKILGLPIYVKESENLIRILSSVKAWKDTARKCISEKFPAAVEADVLYKLQEEIPDLQVELPEVKILLDLIGKVELCRSECKKMLEGSISLKELELLINEWDAFTVNILELELLKQYHKDAVSWKSRVKSILVNISDREDQEHVVDELTCIQRDASSLKIQVEELPYIEIELKKASCRVKALKALHGKTSIDFIEHLMVEASTLHIEKENIFIDISGIYAIAVSWEEKAKHLLGSKADISEFEDAIRASENLIVILPSLDDIKDAISLAKSWLLKSRAFITDNSPAAFTPCFLHKVEDLKELASQSKLLKISLREQPLIQTLLDKCMKWKQDACSLLNDADCLLNVDVMGDQNFSSLSQKLEHQISLMESAIQAAHYLGFEFDMISKLQGACSTFQWCVKALSFSSTVPSIEEIEKSLEIAGRFPTIYASCRLCIVLFDGVIWLKKALEVSVPSNLRRYNLEDAEEVLRQSQNVHVSSPVIVSELKKAIGKHNLWLEQVQLFFSLDLRDRSLDMLLQLKELGSNDAFNCSEMDMVFSEVHKIEEWKHRCVDMFWTSGDANILCSALLEIRNTLGRSFCIFDGSSCSKIQDLCIFCSTATDNQKLLTCSSCKDCFHLGCIGQPSLETSVPFTCPYCQFMRSGKISKSGYLLKIGRKRFELKELNKLLSDAEDLCLWIEEISLLSQIVDKGLELSACLGEILDFALACVDKDLSVVSTKLCVALKAVDVTGFHECESNCKLELALSRNSWRVGAQKLMDGPQKPTIQQLRQHLKEGLAISISSKDYFRQRLNEVRNIGLQWADTAKKVAADGGALQLDKVFDLISEGENLAVNCEKELKLLRDRSMLYCICRRPNDQRPMIACDKCDEWYHFDCIHLSSSSLPKTYICPACIDEREDADNASIPTSEEGCGIGKPKEPQTPSPRHTEARRKSRKLKAAIDIAIAIGEEKAAAPRQCSNVVGLLLWRNRKPCKRAARKRTDLESLSHWFSSVNNSNS